MTSSPHHEQFRERSGQIIAPDERRRKHRQAARVVVVADGRVLLFTDTDPGVPGSAWWVTPGGGIDPGETPLDAAVREMAEETGWVASPHELIGPIAHRVAHHGYSDQVLVQEEWFYRLEVPEPFEVDTSGFTELEKLTLTDHGWFGADDLAAEVARGVEVWPAALADLMCSDPGTCIEMGDIEESTVPI